METKRIEWVDIAKGIGMILVLVGHISHIKILNNFIYSFHMPLFFLISGYLYKNKENFIKNKLKKVIVPYLVFSLLCYIYWFFIERHIREQLVSPLNAFFNILIARGGDENYIFNVVLWFLPCLFTTELTMWLLKEKLKIKKLWIIISISSIVGYIYPKITEIRLPFCIDIMFTAIVFYYLGYIFRNYVENKLNKNRKRINIGISSIGLICVFVFSNIEKGANMNNLDFNYYTIFYITALIGIIVTYLISRLCNKYNKIIKIIGRNSLYIMCIHEPIKRMVIALYAKVLGCGDELLREKIIHICIITAILLFITLLISIIFTKMKVHITKYIDILKCKKTQIN